IAAAGAALFERLRLPTIAGFLLMGALLGPGGLALGSDPEDVRVIAEFGVVFLLFEIGLELPVDRVRRLLRAGLGAGALQVGGTLAIVSAVAVSIGLPWRTALVLGALVAMSSTALVVRLLGERGEVHAPHGQFAIAILLFQDLCIVPFLLAIPILAAPGAVQVGPVVEAVVRAGLAVGVFYLVARFVLPRLLAGAAGLRSREVFTLVAVLAVVGAAFVAEGLGLTLAVGAFLAGLVLSSSPWGPQLVSEVLPLRGLLLGVFFTAVGMLLDFRVAWEHAGTVLLLLAAAVGVKAFVTAISIGAVLNMGARVGVLSGLALAQTGEFSFVLAQAAGGAGLLDDGLAQSFVAASVLSLLATPFLIGAGERISKWIASEARPQPEAPESAELAGHAVIVGFGLAGRNLARVLEAVGVGVAAVEANPQAAEEARRSGANVIWGDATRAGLLEQLQVERARLVVVAINDPIATRQVVSRVSQLAPHVHVLARTRFVLEVDALESAGASRVVAEELEGAIDLVAQTLHELEIPEGSIARFSTELRQEGYALLREPAALPLDPWLAELLERISTEWLELPGDFAPDRSLVDLDLRATTGVSVLAIERAGTTFQNPSPDFALHGGDRLLAYGNGPALGRACAALGIEREGRSES
ncbi:MAG: hypothetical protein CL910_05665, partial [Deltaproteobacteria bacterium]|nr:hypothetical protein [Deltaproteobacteria bacterium]